MSTKGTPDTSTGKKATKSAKKKAKKKAQHKKADQKGVKKKALNGGNGAKRAEKKKSKKNKHPQKNKNAKKKSPVQLALSTVPKKQRPKKKCCLSRPRCRRCPVAMLRDQTLPPGLTVRHRRVEVVGPQ